MKGKKLWIGVGCLILAVVLGFIIVNAVMPSISEEEVKSRILAAMEPQVEGLEQVYGVEDVALELKIEVISVKKPSLFGEGSIHVTITDYLKSPSFTELEDGEIDEAIHRRYLEMGRFLCYDKLPLEDYKVTVEKSFGADETQFLNSSGSRYRFSYVGFSNSYKAYKDGGVVFSQTLEIPADDRVVCFCCLGTGKVKLVYGNSWTDEPGYAYGSECGVCGGTGYR